MGSWGIYSNQNDTIADSYISIRKQFLSNSLDKTSIEYTYDYLLEIFEKQSKTKDNENYGELGYILSGIFLSLLQDCGGWAGARLDNVKMYMIPLKIRKRIMEELTLTKLFYITSNSPYYSKERAMAIEHEILYFGGHKIPFNNEMCSLSEKVGIKKKNLLLKKRN